MSALGSVSAVARVVLLLALLEPGCARLVETFSESPAAPPAGVATVEIQLPPAGATWVVRETTYTEGTGQARSGTTTWTALGERSHAGRPAVLFSDGTHTHVHDRGSRNWLAVLDRASREVIAWEPHDGTFSSPLWVGKSWVARYTRHDRMQERSMYNAVVVWKVVAFEDVRVPAGTFKAFRVEAWPDERDPVKKRTYWYAPGLPLVLKEVTEGTGEPYGPAVGRDRAQRTAELVEYIAPGRASPATPAPRAARESDAAQPPARRVQALIEALARGPDPGRRTAAADALRQFVPPAINPALPALRAAARNDTVPAVRLAAARALMAIGRALPEAAAALVAAATAAPEAVTALIEASRDPATAVVAIGLLGRVGEKARPAAPILLDVVSRDPDAVARAAAATALGSIGLERDEIPVLLGALRDPSAVVRNAAAASLQDRRTEVLALVERDQRSEVVDVRKRTAQALGALGGTMPGDVVPLLAGTLEDRDAGVRVEAVHALRDVGSPAFGALRAALRHDEPDVRAAAAEAISAVPTDKAEAVPPLVDALADREAGVRGSAVRALASLGRVARPAAERLRAVAEHDPSPEVRALAARALADIGAR